MNQLFCALKSSVVARFQSVPIDPFAPRYQPALLLYNTLQSEAKLRKSRPDLSWIALEREAMHKAASAYAESHGLPAPTLKQIEIAERCATGHSDYAAKWAYGVAESMQAPAVASRRAGSHP